MRQIYCFRVLFLVLTVFLYTQPTLPEFAPIEAHAAKKVKKVKPPKSKHRPNLSYRPKITRSNVKYEGRVGVFVLRDKRAMAFYGGRDDYFSEPVLAALSNSLYQEIKASRIFEQVKKLPSPPRGSMTRKDILALSKQNQLDYVFIADLTAFNLLREKMVARKKGIDFKVNVRFGIFGQLIDAKTGAILWAEPIIRENGLLNTDKRVSAEDYGPSSITAIQNGFNDMKSSLRQLGLEMNK